MEPQGRNAMRRELTDVWLRGVKPPAAGRLEIWDTRAGGLVLRITPAGAATWSVRARTVDGKRTRPKIGTWPAVGIAEARKRALGISAAILAGGDPVAERQMRRAELAARAGLPTVADRLAEWREAKSGDWADSYAAAVLRLCAREIAPYLGTRPLAETSRVDWTTLIARKRRQSASSGANLYRACSAFLNHCEAAGWIDRALLPRKGASVLAPAVEARQRVLTDEELRAIWQAAVGMQPKSRAFIHLLTMTAVRRQEAADVATGEIDLDHGTWSIPGARTKNRTSVTVPLHPVLVADLRAIWPAHGKAAGPGWRLLGDIAGSGLAGFSKIKARVDAKSGVTAWHLHDLRRTARTGMTRLGVPREHAEAALNHISGRSALERTYDRHDFAPEVIAAVQRWQAHVASLVTEAPLGEVVPLRRTH
jgi:integrase